MRFVKSLCFPTNLRGLALVWLGLAGGVFCKFIAFSNEPAWFGLVWLVVCFIRSSCFPMNLLGLASVWFGLAGGVFCTIIVLSHESAWLGVGLGLALCVFSEVILFFISKTSIYASRK